MGLEVLLYYILTFSFGFVLGRIWTATVAPWFHSRTHLQEVQARAIEDHPEQTDLWVHGTEATEVHVRESHMPKSVAVSLIVLGILLAANSVWGQIDNHNRDVRDAHARAQFRTDQCELSARIKLRQEQALNEQLILAQGIQAILQSKNQDETRRNLILLEQGVERTVDNLRNLPLLPPATIQDCQDGKLDSQ